MLGKTDIGTIERNYGPKRLLCLYGRLFISFRTLAVFCCLTVFVVVPAKLSCRATKDYCTLGLSHEVFLVHGWPCPFLQRQCNFQGVTWREDEYYVGPTMWEYWRLWNQVEAFSLRALLVDLSIMLILAATGIVAVALLRSRTVRWLQFSLRTLLLSVLLVAGVLSWWRMNHIRSQEEDNAVAVLNRFIAKVRVADNSTPPMVRNLAGPDWLRSLLTFTVPRTFDRIIALDCNGAFGREPVAITRDSSGCLRVETESIGPKEITALNKLKSLRILSVAANADVTDHSIETLRNLHHLEVLNLGNTGITDEGLRHLDSFPALRTLFVFNTGITDRGLAALTRLSRLENLDLDSTGITDEGLQHLVILGLKRLSVNGTRVSNEGLRQHRCSGIVSTGKGERKSRTGPILGK